MCSYDIRPTNWEWGDFVRGEGIYNEIPLCNESGNVVADVDLLASYGLITLGSNPLLVSLRLYTSALSLNLILSTSTEMNLFTKDSNIFVKSAVTDMRLKLQVVNLMHSSSSFRRRNELHESKPKGNEKVEGGN